MIYSLSVCACNVDTSDSSMLSRLEADQVHFASLGSERNYKTQRKISLIS